jgi:MarR family transcriptional regulator, lower aerobic nicotinate degradation pathway regulator
MKFDIEQSIGFLLSKAHQRGFALFKERLDPYGLTPQQFGLLAFLWKQDALSQAELSEKTSIDRTTMGGLIDRLEKDELVQRLPHPTDRRAYRIHLTARGKSLEGELCVIAGQVRDRFSGRLAPDEQEILRNLLNKLRS